VRPVAGQAGRAVAAGVEPVVLCIRLYGWRKPVKLDFVPLRALMVAGAFVASTMAASAVDISGAGATFPYPIYAKWADAYKSPTHKDLITFKSLRSAS
jgi:hypothetical protein